MSVKCKNCEVLEQQIFIDNQAFHHLRHKAEEMAEELHKLQNTDELVERLMQRAHPTGLGSLTLTVYKRPDRVPIIERGSEVQKTQREKIKIVFYIERDII